MGGGRKCKEPPQSLSPAGLSPRVFLWCKQSHHVSRSIVLSSFHVTGSSSHLWLCVAV